MYSSSYSDDDYISDRFSSLQVRRPCDNECNVVQRNSGYFVEPQDDNNAIAWNIKKMKPHKKTDPFKKDKDLIGEVIYGRRGIPVENDTAIFAFKDPTDLECHAGKCKQDSHHARLHMEINGKCPEEETELAATGFAYKDGEFIFHSTTLNDISKSYLDKKRYGRNHTRVAGEDAQEMIRNCTEKWCEENCPIDWTYSHKKKKNSKK